MRKTTILSIVTLLVVGMFFSTIASAYRGDSSKTGPNYSEERHTAMEKALDSGDYDAWYKLMTEDGRHPRVVDMITKDNFETFVQAHEAEVSGNHEKALELRNELGLGQGDHRGLGNGQSSKTGPNYSEERHTAMEKALDSGDYDAWYKLMTEDGRHPRVVDMITKDNFETFVQAHEAEVSGNHEKALELRNELGLGQGDHRGLGNGQRRGRQRGFRENNFDGNCDNAGRW